MTQNHRALFGTDFLTAAGAFFCVTVDETFPPPLDEQKKIWYTRYCNRIKNSTQGGEYEALSREQRRIFFSPVGGKAKIQVYLVFS